MNPVVGAAIIGVGGSVIVALVGFFTTRAISAKTMNASLAEAHQTRIWDKKATAYEAALAELANRELRRDRAMSLPADPMMAGELLETYFATRDTPEWSEAEGRLMAYSTEKLWNALREARCADREAAVCFNELVEPMEEVHQLRADGNHSGMQQVIDLRVSPAVKRTSKGLVESAARDSELVNLIRNELQMRPRD